MDIRALHARALELATGVVEQVTVGQLRAPTPCAQWRLGELLAHMIGQNHGFAAAARGRGDELDQWRDRPFAGAPGRSWAVSAGEVTAAFAGVTGTVRVPEIRPGLDIPAEAAISFHFLDTLVHGWDVAAALGVPFEPVGELARVVLEVAERVPAGPGHRGPGGAFREVRELDGEGTSEFHRALALLGREPGWGAVSS